MHVYAHAYVCVWQMHAYLVYVKIIIGLFQRQWQKRYLSCSLDFLHNLYFTVAQSFLRGWKRGALFVNCTCKDHAPQKIPKIDSFFGLGFAIPDLGWPQRPVSMIHRKFTHPTHPINSGDHFASHRTVENQSRPEILGPRTWQKDQATSLILFPINMLSSQCIMYAFYYCLTPFH